MSRVLRAASIAGCAVLLGATVGLTAVPAAADATDSTFSVSPEYGQVGQIVTLTAQGQTTFPTDGSAAVMFSQDVAATAVSPVSPTQLSVVVPNGAMTGPVEVQADTTTYDGPTFTLQQPTTWTASLAPSSVIFGQHATLSAALTSAGPVVGPVAGASATLQHRSASSARWHRAPGTEVKQTGAAGRVRWRLTPHRNGSYRVQFAATPTYAAATSAPFEMSVRPRITLRTISIAPAGAPLHVVGKIRPRVGGKLYLEQRRAGVWRGIKHATAHHGTFRFTMTPSRLATLRLRIERHADAAHEQALSRVLKVEIVNRTLRYGSSGHDVAALQNRLRALHYDVGPASSFYGWDMVHAVTAYEKVQGLHRDGIASTSVWKSLAHPKPAHLRRPVPNVGWSVEVNLTKQILMITKNGHLWRVLDTSTGGGYSYTGSNGQPAVAITPSGHFSIQYKQTGWQTSKLGELYYPSYFTNTGFAIHGEGDSNAGNEVPAYPASHGCVRISNRAVLRYYYKVFTVGTPVWVYH